MRARNIGQSGAATQRCKANQTVGFVELGVDLRQEGVFVGQLVG